MKLCRLHFHLAPCMCHPREHTLGRKVLGELNHLWNERYSRSFQQALPVIAPEANLAPRPSRNEKKLADQRQKRKQVNKQLGENATMNMLAEGESLSSYNRKRLSMSFKKPDTPNKRRKSHSPNEANNISWNVTAAVESLKDFPENEIVNWSAVAQRRGATRCNGGQVHSSSMARSLNHSSHGLHSLCHLGDLRHGCFPNT